MRVLLLSPTPWEIERTLRPDEVTVAMHEVPEDVLQYDFLVSYRFRSIIRDERVFNKYGNKAINLHISLLPYNRGADPIYWAIHEGSPMGVTIHVLTRGVDRGPIYAQRRLNLYIPDELDSHWEAVLKRTHYESMVDLFRLMWPLIRKQELTPIPQGVGGSYHYVKDRAEHELRQASEA